MLNRELKSLFLDHLKEKKSRFIPVQKKDFDTAIQIQYIKKNNTSRFSTELNVTLCSIEYTG